MSLLLWALAMAPAAFAAKPWLVLPPIPDLPAPAQSDEVHVNGIDLWYAEYGSGKPVILLHGGLGNSNWWGLQIPALAGHYRVIVIDSRGQGRSGHDPDATMTYRLMARDVLALLDHLHIDKAAIVGWSDGSITGLEMAIHHPERVSKLFAFGANTTPAGYVGSSGRSPAQQAVVDEYSRLMRSGYMKMSPTPGDYEAFHKKMSDLWNTRPNISAEQLQGITVPTWIVDGDHDEIIRRKDIDFQFHQIPGALELIIPGTSHFAFLQKPEVANAALLRFMAWQPQASGTQ
ncbi:MAG TPA: alpha/beta hydrolase [Oleiagrimonas sp.]|nr:alpha/beta hydrolase [Oleiagrimonas sp.]